MAPNCTRRRLFVQVESTSVEAVNTKAFLGTHPLEPGVGWIHQHTEGGHWDGHNLRRQVWSSAKKSFGVECSDWIEAHGAQRRDITGGERDSGKYKGDASEGGQIRGRHAVEQSGHEVRDDERTGHTQPGASGGQTESPAQDHLEDGASLSSQREANGHLTSLFIHNIGNS